MPDRSKGKARRSVAPGPQSWDLGLGLSTPTPEESTVTKIPEPMVKARGGDQHRVLAPVKKINLNSDLPCVLIVPIRPIPLKGRVNISFPIHPQFRRGSYRSVK